MYPTLFLEASGWRRLLTEHHGNTRSFPNINTQTLRVAIVIETEFYNEKEDVKVSKMSMWNYNTVCLREDNKYKTYQSVSFLLASFFFFLFQILCFRHHILYSE